MAEELTLTDQHFDPPKTFTGSYGAVHLQRCSGIILEIKLRHERVAVEHERPLTIDECDNIIIQNSDIASDDDGDHSDDVYGLYVTHSDTPNANFYDGAPPPTLCLWTLRSSRCPSAIRLCIYQGIWLGESSSLPSQPRCIWGCDILNHRSLLSPM